MNQLSQIIQTASIFTVVGCFSTPVEADLWNITMTVTLLYTNTFMESGVIILHFIPVSGKKKKHGLLSICLSLCPVLPSPPSLFFFFCLSTSQNQHSALTLSTWLWTVESWSMCFCQRLHSGCKGKRKRKGEMSFSQSCFRLEAKLFWKCFSNVSWLCGMEYEICFYKH